MITQFKIWRPFILTACVVLGALTVEAEVNFQTSEQSQPQSRSRPAAPEISDAEIIGWLSAVNQNEINAAESAMGKGLSPQVQNYASMMQAEHSQNQDKISQLSQTISVTPEDTAQIVEKQRAKGEKTLTKLGKLEGDKFAKAYVKAMVKDHSEALSMINKKMLPNAQSPELKQHLMETRDHISDHLDHAKQLRSSL